MPYERRDRSGALDQFGDWAWPAPLPLAQSEALRRLTDAMHRYTTGEISGRTFLVAGHRGAGKTTLVRNAADLVSREILTHFLDLAKLADTARPNEAPRYSLLAVPQRPLLVRISGPSLLMTELPGPGAGEPKPKPEKPASPPNKTPTQASSAGEQDAAAPSAEPAPAAANSQGAEPPDTDPTAEASAAYTQSILVQLTAGLYRTLAAECARAFALAAREDGREDQLELAAQLTMALDDGADAAALRAYWDKFRRMEGGLFWPRIVGQHFAASGLSGMGAREILAVATAGQIFQVCIGKLVVSRTRTDTNTADGRAGRGDPGGDKGEDKAGPAIGSLLKPLTGAAGVALLGGGAAAAAFGQLSLGIPLAIAGLLGLGWTATFTMQRKDVLNSTLTLDRSAASLERDLPLAMDRIKQAGLAPIFMVDEIDKLTPEEFSRIRYVFRRLKQLTTDYGFFCFLADRAFFDEVQRKVETSAYPVEYSLYSERLYVLPDAKDLEDFLLREILSPQPAESPFLRSGQPPSGPADGPILADAARMILVKDIAHRAKMNMIDAVRALGCLSEVEPVQLRTEGPYRYAAAIQLAIEAVMRRPEYASRGRQDGAFRQWLVDALYIVSRAWEKDEEAVAVAEDDVCLALLTRLDIPVPRAAARATLEKRAGKRETELIVKAFAELVAILGDFRRFDGILPDHAALSPDTVRLFANLPPLLKQPPAPPALPQPTANAGTTRRGGNTAAADPRWGYLSWLPPLLGKPAPPAAPAEPPPPQLAFAFNSAGHPVEPKKPQLTDAERQALQDLLTFAGNRAGLLRWAEGGGTVLPFDRLIGLRLLAPYFEDAAIAGAARRLSDSLAIDGGESRTDSDQDFLHRFRLDLQRAVPGIAILFALTLRIETDTARPPGTCLNRLLAALGGFDAVLRYAPAAAGERRLVTDMPDVEDMLDIMRWHLQTEGIPRAFWDDLAGRFPNVAAVITELDWPDFWARMVDVLRGRLLGHATPANRPTCRDLIVAAYGNGPIGWLPASSRDPTLPAMPQWSLILLQALAALGAPAPAAEPAGPAIPAWLCIPALFALKFSRGLIESVSARLTDVDRARVGDYIDRARPGSPRGTLLFVENGTAEQRAAALRPGDTPVLIVEKDQLTQYEQSLRLLTDLQAFEGTFNEWQRR